MKWILTLALTSMASTALADLPLASDHLPLASDQHKARTAECPCGTVCPCQPCECIYQDGNYEWKRCNDRHQIALYYDGAQVGVYYYGSGYYALQGDTWCKRSTPSGCSSPPSALASPPPFWHETSGIIGRVDNFRSFRGGCSGGG